MITKYARPAVAVSILATLICYGYGLYRVVAEIRSLQATLADAQRTIRDIERNNLAKITDSTSSYDLFGQRFITAHDQGFRNYYIGPNAGNTTSTTAGENTGIGVLALSSVTIGNANVAIGNFALANHRSGSGSVAIGANAIQSSTGVIDVTAVGYEANRKAVTGVGDTSVGRRALGEATVARNNTGVGDSALRMNQGTSNVGMGYRVGEYLKSGDSNVFIGLASSANRLSGSENVFVGAHSNLLPIADPDKVTGHGALAAGDRNVGAGYEVLLNYAGSDATAVGYRAGSAITTGSNNIFIGANAGTSEAQKTDATNSIAIGAGTYTTKDNQIIIGNDDATEIVIGGVSMTASQLKDLLFSLNPASPAD